MAVDFNRAVYCILGLPFDAVEMVGAIQRVKDAAARRTPCFISTPNVNWVIACRTDSQLLASVISSDLSVADGTPLIWIARLLGIPIRVRIAGSDMFEQLRQELTARLPVFFFGGEQGVAEAACRRLNAEHSGLVCAGFADPGFGSVEEMSTEETLARINRSGADFVVVSLGAKKGQAWIERNRARLSAPVICHLGAVVNFVAGTLKRAPLWMHSAGLEWLWRIAAEPKLWRRYLADGLAFSSLFVTRVLPYAWYLARYRPDGEALAAASVDVSDDGQQSVVRLRGAWTQQNLGPLRECLAKTVLAAKDVRLEMGDVAYVDSAFVGLLMLLQGHQTGAGRQLRIASRSAAVRRVMNYCCAEHLY